MLTFNKQLTQNASFLLVLTFLFSSPVNAQENIPPTPGKDSVIKEKLPAVLSPEPGSTIPGRSVEFKWEEDPDVAESWLYVGTTVGGKEIYTNHQDKEHSVTVKSIPQNGGPVYVRLWSKLKDQWGSRDFMYETVQADETLSVNMTPANGEYLTRPSVDFSWDAVPGVTEYWLSVGTTPEGSDIYTQSQETSTSATVNSIPIDGSLTYVQLWYKRNDQWDSQKFVYSTDEIKRSPVKPIEHQWMITPADGTILRESVVNFSWSSVPKAAAYSLAVETKKGTENIFHHEFGPQASSAKVAEIPANAPFVYVKLGVKVDEQWYYQNYVYQTRRADVFLAQIASPEPGAILKDSRVAFMWSGGNNINRIWLSIGTDRGGKDLFNEIQGEKNFVLVDGLPLDGKAVFVRLWSEIDGIWFYEDYTYSTELENLETAKIKNFFPDAVLTGQTMEFTWDPVFSALEYSLRVGSVKGGKDIDVQDSLTLPRATVNNLPLDGRTVYVRLYTRSGDKLVFRDYEYKTKKSSIAPAKITKVVDAAGSAQKTLSVYWNEGESILEYRLDVGTELGKKDITRLENGMDTSVLVSGLEEDRKRIYLRLWSKTHEGWIFKDYLYKMDSSVGKLVELAQERKNTGHSSSPVAED